MSEPVTITLPLPDRKLSPNSRTHWAAKAKAVKAARAYAAWQTVGNRLGLDAATITVTPYYRDRRRHDSDNLLASLKPSIDGLVDAGLLTDDNRVTYTVHPAQVDKLRPRVEITVTPN
jgi:crossover junction endodeoxyribonuclease RusA